jgi:hypothetical protein
MKNPFTWFRRSRLDDISDEIRSHIEEKTDALVAAGMSRADAEAAARRSFGNVTSTQDAHLRKLRRPASDWIVKREPALLEQHERRSRGDRFRHRRNAEQCVALDRQPILHIAPSNTRSLDHLAVAPD